MKAKELRGKSAEELNKERVELLKEQFTLRMQRATGQLSRPHRFRQVRRDIARINTVLNQKQRDAGPAAAGAQTDKADDV